MRNYGGIVALVLVLGVVGCADDGLDGPERFEFEDVDRAAIDVESGRVTVFGTDEDHQGVTLHRWWSREDDFRRLEEHNSSRELIVESECLDDRACRARYELSLNRDTQTETTVGEGTLEIFKLGAAVEATLGEGELSATALSAPIADLEIESGDGEVGFVEPPEHLRLTAGDGAAFQVRLPDEAYQCHFDVEAPDISVGELNCDPTAAGRLEVVPPDAEVDFAVRSGAN